MTRSAIKLGRGVANHGQTPSYVNQKGKVGLRRLPYPFRAALAICSDIDGTGSLERFLSIQRFLNTEENTPVGRGIGLEIGNSFFPYTPDDSFGFFSSRPADREAIRTLVRSGHIDCLHSYGDGARSRGDALRALEELEREGRKVEVWVDHARAPSNFGKDVTPGLGDVIDSPVYHADATLAYGVRFVWKGRTSGIVGHGVPFTADSFIRMCDRAHPLRSLFNMARELAKTTLAYAGNRRFAIHSRNQLLRVDRLQDGQAIYEFKRCNNHWLGLSHGHDCGGLAYVLRPQALQTLVASGGYMIVYTHLGTGLDSQHLIPVQTQAVLRGLADAYRQGEIFVTTTSRLLNYYVNSQHVQWSHQVDPEGRVAITIHGVDDPLSGFRPADERQLQGITFYVPDRHKAQIQLGGRQLLNIDRNPFDHTGRESVAIPRTFLAFPFSSQASASGHAGTMRRAR